MWHFCFQGLSVNHAGVAHVPLELSAGRHMSKSSSSFLQLKMGTRQLEITPPKSSSGCQALQMRSAEAAWPEHNLESPPFVAKCKDNGSRWLSSSTLVFFLSSVVDVGEQVEEVWRPWKGGCEFWLHIVSPLYRFPYRSAEGLMRFHHPSLCPRQKRRDEGGDRNIRGKRYRYNSRQFLKQKSNEFSIKKATNNDV